MKRAAAEIPGQTATLRGCLKRVHGDCDELQRLRDWLDGCLAPARTGARDPLTKDETTVMFHYGADRTEQWLMVRLDSNNQPQPQDSSD